MAKDKDNDEVTMADVLSRLADIQAQNQELQKQHLEVQRRQIKQTAPRSNTRAPEMSVFNPRGNKDFPMPALRCEVFMPFQQRPGLHGMDREEVELMNAVIEELEQGHAEASIEKNDGEVMKVILLGRKNHEHGVIESVRFSGPPDPDTNHPTPWITHSNKQQMPPLRILLRQILGDATAFRDEENAARYGRPDSAALGIMSIRDEIKAVQQYIKADPTTRDEASEVRIPTVDLAPGYKGPLAISVGE